MRIVLYKGGAQYNALNRFSEKLGEGLKKIGHEIEMVDLVEADKKKELLIDAMARKPQLVIGFNGMGAEIRTTEQKSIYDISESQYLSLLLDHPAFHTGRTVRAPANAITGVVDRTHIDYLKEISPRHPTFFAPHGGVQSPDYRNADRPIDILFLGTGMNAAKERESWELFPHSYQMIMEEAFEEFLKEPQAWEKLIRAAAERRFMHFPMHLMAPMIVQLEIVMRAEYRMKILKKFDEAGLKVTIMGNGWEHMKFKNHEIHPSTEFYEALKLMTKAKIALNASPQFFNGSHERVFVAMLNGTVPITSASTYYDEHFVDNEHYLAYDLPTLPSAIEKLKELLGTPKKMKAIQQNSLKIAMTDHTWEKRAEEFVDKLQTLQISQFLYKKQWGL